MQRNKNGQFIKGYRKDYTGLKIAKLTFLEFDHERVSTKGNRRVYWKVRCECGSECVKCVVDIQTGKTTSCGCVHKKATSKARRIHGESDTRLYYIWENMKKRCFNPNSDRYKNYGARGITVIEEWMDYATFSKWAHSSGYKDDLTIERNNPDGNYEPSNCTWITMDEQAKNRTTNKWVTIDGKTYSPLELEEIYNIPVKTIYARIARGDKGEAVVRPLGKRQFYKR